LDRETLDAGDGGTGAWVKLMTVRAEDGGRLIMTGSTDYSVRDPSWIAAGKESRFRGQRGREEVDDGVAAWSSLRSA